MSQKLFDEIAAALDAKQIYNVDFVRIKDRLNRVLNSAHNTVQNEYLDLPYEERSGDEALQDVYYGTIYPHTLKTFAKRVAKAAEVHGDDHPVVVAGNAMIEQFREPVANFLALKAFVIKSRKPSETPRATPERTLENTGTCAICGRNVKLSSTGKIVDHGFTLAWDQRSGSCFGVGYDPIEVSPEGLVAAIHSLSKRIMHCRTQLQKDHELDVKRNLTTTSIECVTTLEAFTARLGDWEAKPLPGNFEKTCE